MLRWLFVSWIANAVTLGITALVLHGVDVILKPILKLVTLPFAIMTLGVAWFFVSLLMLWLTQLLVSGFDIHGFGTYIWATIIVWAVNLVVDNIFHRQSHRRRAPATT
jgi:putative membrane protein